MTDYEEIENIQNDFLRDINFINQEIFKEVGARFEEADTDLQEIKKQVNDHIEGLNSKYANFELKIWSDLRLKENKLDLMELDVHTFLQTIEAQQKQFQEEINERLKLKNIIKDWWRRIKIVVQR